MKLYDAIDLHSNNNVTVLIMNRIRSSMKTLGQRSQFDR
jgi:hypothetical protein